MSDNLNETNNEINESNPVSYTHLDVYKRQCFNFCFGSIAGVAILSSTRIIPIRTRLGVIILPKITQYITQPRTSTRL